LKKNSSVRIVALPTLNPSLIIKLKTSRGHSTKAFDQCYSNYNFKVSIFDVYI